MPNDEHVPFFTLYKKYVIYCSLLEDKKDILNKTKNGLFKVVQEYEPKCYLFNGVKINLQVYVLIICRKGVVKTWVYRDGIMSYTKININPILYRFIQANHFIGRVSYNIKTI